MWSTVSRFSNTMSMGLTLMEKVSSRKAMSAVRFMESSSWSRNSDLSALTSSSSRSASSRMNSRMVSASVMLRPSLRWGDGPSSWLRAASPHRKRTSWGSRNPWPRAHPQRRVGPGAGLPDHRARVHAGRGVQGGRRGHGFREPHEVLLRCGDAALSHDDGPWPQRSEGRSMTDAETILEFIRDEADLEEDEVSADTSLFRDQLLDSMNLTALIVFLEKTFSIKVKPMDIVFENLDTANHMLAYIARKKAVSYTHLTLPTNREV